MILLLVSAALLTTIGVVEVFSASSVYAFTNYDNSFWFLERQAIYAAIGIGVLLVTARMRYVAWRRLSVPLVIISVALLLLALHPTAGSSVYGASRWIGLGPLTLQPSEFAKLALDRVRGDGPRAEGGQARQLAPSGAAAGARGDPDRLRS